MSKLGVQGWLIGVGSAEFQRFCVEAKPAVIKILDFHAAPRSALEKIREAAPRSFIVYRHVAHSHNADPYRDPVAEADRWYDAIRPALLERRGLFDAFETLNEVVPGDLEAAKRYVAFEERVCQRAAADGFRVVICCFPHGTPDIPLFDFFRSWRPPANTILGPHEYAWHGDPTWGWHMRRYEKWAPPGVPIFIGETGNEPGGWVGKMGADAFIRLLSDYDAYLLQDPRVIGAAIFVFNDAWGNWTSYAVHPHAAEALRALLALGVTYFERPSVLRPRWTGTVTASRLRLRSGPGLGFPILALMPRGTILKVFEVENGWARVRWEERGLEGFAYLPYLDLRPIPEASAFGIDLSFSDVAKAGTDWLDSLPHGRPAIAVQNLFTGWATPRPAFSNIEALARAGLAVAAYVVANPALPLRVYEDIARRAKDFPLRAVFVDIEPTETIPAHILTENALRAICEKVREAFGLPTGIYTGAWVWSRLGNPKWPWLADFPLWTARYDGRFDLPARESYGPEGWRVVGKQFRGTTRTASWLVSVDLNAFDPSFFAGKR
jgi:hypothetical protein